MKHFYARTYMYGVCLVYSLYKLVYKAFTKELTMLIRVDIYSLRNREIGREDILYNSTDITKFVDFMYNGKTDFT